MGELVVRSGELVRIKRHRNQQDLELVRRMRSAGSETAIRASGPRRGRRPATMQYYVLGRHNGMVMRKQFIL